MPDHELLDVAGWKPLARMQQRLCHESCANKLFWSGFPTSDEEKLQMRLAFVVHGPPPVKHQNNIQTSGYKDTQVHRIHHLSKKIKQHFNNDEIKIKVIFVSSNRKCELIPLPVFRIYNLHKDIFIDISYRVYKSWSCYLKENDLPACHLCFPTNGDYDLQNGEIKLSFQCSPACSWTVRAVHSLDIIVLVTALIGTIVTLSSMSVPGLNVPMLLGIFVGAAAIYYLSRLVHKTFDILQHW